MVAGPNLNVIWAACTVRRLGKSVQGPSASPARTIDWRIRPILERFGDRALTDIKTADVEDFIADLRKPRIVGKRTEERCLTPASINRTIELLRDTLNQPVGRDARPRPIQAHRRSIVYPFSRPRAKCRFAKARPEPDFR
jgi:hypothetical protein